ncbi:MAG: pantoate--beta-alanine ligase [Proteobacteria bacterium]|nr:MAG: pantoate--beta-alanine ligase [Pseudomonadota bacterium]
MNISETPEQIRQFLAPLRSKNIAFVATMGCLHAGHINLIRKAKSLADVVVVSIYVNPMQFGENEDFSKYPNTFEKDTEICKNEGVDVIFHPSNLYPSDGAKVTLKVRDISNLLCGISRPSHFDGVVTVVNMLFNIIRPDIAIFGEKDWQQLAIIRRMVSDLHMPIEIIGSDIIRESDGLAMSSRNRYLSPSERQKSLCLSQTMLLVKNNIEQGEKALRSIQFGIDNLRKYDIHPEYLEIRDELTLKPENNITSQSRMFIAAKIGNTRLIDNASLKSATENTL